MLRREADLVPLARLRDAIENGRRERLPVAITFDDGYSDNYSTACPILERFEAPATIFLSTGLIGSGCRFWSDRLAQLVMGATTLPNPISLALGGTPFSVSTSIGRPAVLDALWRKLRTLPQPGRESALRALERLLPVPGDADNSQLPMTSEQAAEISSRGLVSIGAHTRSHCLLTSLSADEQMAEIAGSKAEAEAMTGRPVTEFAYPYGWYDGLSVACVGEAGFSLACTTVPQAATRGSSAFALPRYAVADVDGETFARSLWLRLRSIGNRLAPAA